MNMVFKRDKEEAISETGNWNVADSFSKVKIMRPLALCDYYEDIATYGYESIADELIDYQAPPNDFIKITALRRLIKELIKLIKNTKFALKLKGTRTNALKYKEHLEKIESVIPKIIDLKYNPNIKRKEFKITDESLFNSLLEKVTDIKSKINEPLNKNHLIFTDKEEFDPRAFKEQMKERMRKQG